MVKDADEIALLTDWPPTPRTGSSPRSPPAGSSGGPRPTSPREVRERLIAEGHDEAQFAIVGSGPNSASPHHEASDRVIQAGEPIVLDIGGTLGGYGSDITRTLWVTGGDPAKGPDERFRHLFAVLHGAQAAATRGGPPGRRLRGGRRRRATADRGRGLRRGVLPPDRARDRARGPRGAVHHRRQRRAAPARDGLLGRARDLPRRASTAPGSRTSSCAGRTVRSSSTRRRASCTSSTAEACRPAGLRYHRSTDRARCVPSRVVRDHMTTTSRRRFGAATPVRGVAARTRRPMSRRHHGRPHHHAPARRRRPASTRERRARARPHRREPTAPRSRPTGRPAARRATAAARPPTPRGGPAPHGAPRTDARPHRPATAPRHGAPTGIAATAPPERRARRTGAAPRPTTAAEPAPPTIGNGDRNGQCTAPQLRRFIKSRPYVPMHELRRRFGINGDDDDVDPGPARSGLDLRRPADARGSPARRAAACRRDRLRAVARPADPDRHRRLPDAPDPAQLTPAYPPTADRCASRRARAAATPTVLPLASNRPVAADSDASASAACPAAARTSARSTRALPCAVGSSDV